MAEAVSAYYEAGRRPADSQFAVQDAPEVVEPAVEQEAVEAEAPSDLSEAVVTASGQSLEELAEELEALIDSIRYGSDAT